MTEKINKNRINSVYNKFGFYYDVLYNNYIDYISDCDCLEILFKKNYRHETSNYEEKVQSILDLGCGTGNHVLELGKRGYNVIGLDFSQNCLKCAQAKVQCEPELKSKVHFILQDLKEVALKAEFDVILALFGVLSYIPEDDDIPELLLKIRNLLKPGGLFMGEIWQYSGVPSNFTNKSRGVSKEEHIELVRTIQAQKLKDSYTTEVKMDFTLKNTETKETVETFSEFHYMRGYDLNDFKQMLEGAGLKLLKYYDADVKTFETFFV
jgi:SAM-dependent methyltransferase